MNTLSTLVGVALIAHAAFCIWRAQRHAFRAGYFAGRIAQWHRHPAPVTEAEWTAMRDAPWNSPKQDASFPPSN